MSKRQRADYIEIIRRITRGETLHHKDVYEHGDYRGCHYFVVNGKRQVVNGNKIRAMFDCGFIEEREDCTYAVTDRGREELAEYDRSIRHWAYSPVS